MMYSIVLYCIVLSNRSLLVYHYSGTNTSTTCQYASLTCQQTCIVLFVQPRNSMHINILTENYGINNREQLKPAGLNSHGKFPQI